MPNDPDSDVLNDFLEQVIEPLCIELASRIGAETPRTTGDDQHRQVRITLPRSFRSATGQHFTVRLEPFDDETFLVKASRLDQVDELRRLEVVRYDRLESPEGFAESAAQVQNSIDSAFEQLRAHVTNERT